MNELQRKILFYTVAIFIFVMIVAHLLRAFVVYHECRTIVESDDFGFTTCKAPPSLDNPWTPEELNQLAPGK